MTDYRAYGRARRSLSRRLNQIATIDGRHPELRVFIGCAVPDLLVNSPLSSLEVADDRAGLTAAFYYQLGYARERLCAALDRAIRLRVRDSSALAPEYLAQSLDYILRLRAACYTNLNPAAPPFIRKSAPYAAEIASLSRRLNYFHYRLSRASYEDAPLDRLLDLYDAPKTLFIAEYENDQSELSRDDADILAYYAPKLRGRLIAIGRRERLESLPLPVSSLHTPYSPYAPHCVAANEPEFYLAGRHEK